MRVLRSSLYVDPHMDPMTTVLRDSDVIDTLESIRWQTDPAEALVVSEIFSMPDGDIVAATMEAEKRHRQVRAQEQDQAVLFFWSVMAWDKLNPGGSLVMPKPAPLSVEAIETVFTQLAQHPKYENFTCTIPSQDDQVVTLRDGEIEVESTT